MKSIIVIVASFLMLSVIAFQVQSVNAQKNNKHESTDLSRLLTSPCKFGFGFGDDNHCHSGPKGLSDETGETGPRGPTSPEPERDN